ncbi:PAS domain-containing sensor histidine kinase [Fundidesulfovibrio agrisoli]|uniref:PAS domain-containing sensor histidine kinase n=1 Tax=Fundidesulfovibrio agrisoli TaxID=2922717 RepID=UPI001FAC1F05|nr:PAS domain-containing protein [Fundidesulfovibrio agrisoli]
MNNPLVFSLLAGIISFSLFVLVNAFLYFKHRDKALLFWAFAWSALVLRNITVLCGVYWGKSGGLLLLEQMLVLGTSAMLLLGVHELMGKRAGRWFHGLFAAAAAWVCAGAVVHIPVPWFYVPTYGIFGAAKIIVGRMMLKNAPPGGVGGRLSGWLLILWGLHTLDYPFLRPLGIFAPWGFIIGGVLGLLTALGLILAYFERVTHDLDVEKDRFHSLFRSQAAPILLLDAGTLEILDANDGAARVYGFRPAELRGMDFGLMSALPRGDFVTGLKVALDAGDGGFLAPQRLRSGELRFVEVFCSPARVDGRAVLFSLVHDVTERILAQDALRESEARYRAVVDQAGVGIVLMDASGVVRTWNPKAEEILGVTADAALGHPIQERDWKVTWEDGKPMAVEDFPSMRTLRTGKPVVDAVLGVRFLSGELRWITVNTTPILMEGERTLRAVSITFSDDTLRRRQEAELRAARRAAEASSEAKSVFLANMSHELRTPLNGIIGMLEILESGTLDPERRRHLTVVLKSSRRLANLLGDILDLSSLEEGRLGLAPAPFAPASLAAALEELFAPAAREGGITLECAVAPDVPPMLAGDEPRMRQILFNLVGNAVKFTARGRVRVEISRLPGAGPEAQRLLFLVEDTGPGISDAQLKQIFEPFVQGEGSYIRQYQGAGLGLSIVRRLVGLMGGSLDVESEEGRGTRVYLVLPFGSCGGQGAAPHTAALPPPSLPRARDRGGPWPARRHGASP